jgi:hypothetical protein
MDDRSTVDVIFSRSGFGLDDRSVLIVAAVGTNPVRHHGLAALGALAQVDRRKVLVSSAFVPPCPGGTFLRYCHD